LGFYNYKRIHSAIDYKTPHEKTKEMKKQLKKLLIKDYRFYTKKS